MNCHEMLTPLTILELYKSGFFLMGIDRNNSAVHLIDPPKRALLPINNFHCPKSLVRFIKKKPFTVTINKKFEEVISECATYNRDGTWINEFLENKFIQLHKLGYAHSIECWQEKKLVGGLYGVSLGGCFFAESMFSKISNASKYALVYLVSRLQKLQYKLLDVQFVNPHLEQFGVFELEKNIFKKKLQYSLRYNKEFFLSNHSDKELFKDVLDFLHLISIKS